MESGLKACRKWRRASTSGTRKIDHNLCADILRQCAESKSLEEGRHLHQHIARAGLDRGTFLGNALVQMYGSCGSLEEARFVFENLRERNVFSWNIMIAAYAQNGHIEEARLTFESVPRKDVVSWNAMLAAYCQCGAFEDSQRLFGKMPLRDVVSLNTMIAVYAQAGQIEKARETFRSIPERNVVSWNALLAAYAENEQHNEELSVFDSMEAEGIQPNSITFSGALDSVGSVESGRSIHAKIVEAGCGKDLMVMNSLVRMYGRFGSMQDARGIFCEADSVNVILCTAMIAVCAQNGHSQEALELFGRMDLEGLQPDAKALSAILDACANLSALKEGKFIHRHIIDGGLLPDLALGTALINLYGKCGGIEDALKVFQQMPEKNEVSWSAMVAAYAQTGHTKQAIELFQEMNLEGVFPDAITFVSVLSACSHAGMKPNGAAYFVSMQVDYGFVPGFSHFACMVDLLGRCGELEKAESLIQEMPFEPDGLTWTTLVGACGVHGDPCRGARIGANAMVMHLGSSAPYVLLSNLSSLRQERLKNTF